MPHLALQLEARELADDTDSAGKGARGGGSHRVAHVVLKHVPARASVHLPWSVPVRRGHGVTLTVGRMPVTGPFGELGVK